jgi:hypothetical protein
MIHGRPELAAALAALLVGVMPAGAAAATGYAATLSSTYPTTVWDRSVPPRGFTVTGTALAPYAADLGVTDLYLNTHSGQFYELHVAVMTNGVLGPAMVCSGNRTDCSITEFSWTALTVSFNPQTLVGVNGGQSVAVFVRHFWPRAGGGTFAVDSNTITIPIVGSLSGPPTGVKVVPATFSTDATAWNLNVSASNVDGSAYATLDSIGTLSVPVALTGAASGAFALPIPPDRRTSGTHTVTVCRQVKDPASAGNIAYCAAPVTVSVQAPFERAVGVSGSVLKTDPGIGLLNTSAARSLTVTCARAPLYSDVSGTPLTAGGSAVVLPQNSVAMALGAPVQGSAASYYRLDLGATAYISTACVR